MPVARLVETDCPECEGLGWIQRIEEDGRRYASRCDCVLRRRGEFLLGVTDIPERYSRCSIASFKTSNHTKPGRDQLVRAKTLAERYVTLFLAEGGLRAPGLLFVGPPGVGKTHLASSVLAELVQRYQVRGRFVDFTHLIHAIQASFDPRSNESAGGILDSVVDADVLVIDELGAQKPTPFVQSMLYEVINGRYTARRPTIFTCNYLPDVLIAEDDQDDTSAASDARVVESTPRSKARPGTDADVLERNAHETSEERRPMPPPLEPRARPELLSSRIGPLILSRLYEMTQAVVMTAVSDYRMDILGSANRWKR